MFFKTLSIIKLLANIHFQNIFIAVIITGLKRFENLFKAVSTSQTVTEESQDISSSVIIVLMMT